MTVKECYELMEGDYAGVISRLQMEKLVERFARKFLDDPSFQNLQDALAAENYDDAFREAHTLKGVCQNLGLDKLFHSSDAVTEYLRNNKSAVPAEMMEQLSSDYEIVVGAISQLG